MEETNSEITCVIKNREVLLKSYHLTWEYKKISIIKRGECDGIDVYNLKSGKLICTIPGIKLPDNGDKDYDILLKKVKEEIANDKRFI